MVTDRRLVDEVLGVAPPGATLVGRGVGLGLVALGVVGLVLGFFAAPSGAGWTALLVATVLSAGIGAAGVLISAIFQLTGARWGRAYRRMAEASAALMPIGLAGAVVLLVGGNAYLPWVHHHPHIGGKAVWLTRGFWDVRVVLALVVAYGVALRFLYFALRRDFCVDGVKERFGGPVARFVSRDIADPQKERERCERRLDLWAPAVPIVYAVCFTLLGFDLIMALEPDWFSTLFGAWYFIGNLFVALALLALVSTALRKRLPLDRFLTETRQADLATLLFAFCLVNTDFFWSQYLTIWYGNLPEETVYVIERSLVPGSPWTALSWVSLAGFFAIPFVALLFRKIKRSAGLLQLVAVVVCAGIFLARFLEVGPALMDIDHGAGLGAVAMPLVALLLTVLGFAGAGLMLYVRLLGQVPVFPIGDDVFARELAPHTEDDA